MDHGQLKSLVAGKYGLTRNTLSTRFLPANKVDIIAAFSSETINKDRKNAKAGKYADLNKAFFKWFMPARSSNKSMCGLALQEKTIDLAKQKTKKNQKLLILKHPMDGLTDGKHEIMYNINNVNNNVNNVNNLKQYHVQKNRAQQK